MEFKHLKTFIAVADSKSFLKAAESLYLTRQAITKTIDQLEAELGIELFFRTQKGAMMTPAGIYFYPRAAQIISEMEKLKEDSMDLKRSYRPKINICLSFGLYERYATSLYNYHEQHSGEFQLELRGSIDADSGTVLGDRKSDAIISFTKPSENFAETIKIAESPIVFLVSKNDASSNRDIGISQLPKLLYSGGFEHPLWWNEKPGKDDIVSSDISYLYSLLQSGKGIMPMPKIAVPDYLNFVMILPAFPEQKPCEIYYSTLQKDHYNALTGTLLDDILTNAIINV